MIDDMHIPYVGFLCFYRYRFFYRYHCCLAFRALDERPELKTFCIQCFCILFASSEFHRARCVILGLFVLLEIPKNVCT